MRRSGGSWVAETVGLKGTDSSQWYWAPFDNTVTQADSEPVLAGGDKIRITYEGVVEIVARVDNDDEILRRAGVEGTTGIVERVDDRTGTLGRAAVFSVAAALLTEYATEGRTLRFKSAVPGLASGQILTVNLAPYGLEDREFLITAVTSGT